VIDEASQVPVASAAAYFLLLREDGHVILAGDHKQLGPIYGFEMRDSVQGLFDCIFSYMQETHRKDPVALDRNYRTNTEISGWPKERFYSEGYEAFFPERRLEIALPPATGSPPDGWPENLPWSDLFLRILDPEIPVVVISYGVHTSTLSNPFEAQMVAALALLYRRILEQDGNGPGDQEFWAEHLGIVTPHRAQMSTIRNLLVDAAGMPMDPPPFVDTVDRFQGQERDLMIASYVVADRDFVAAEEAFILNPRRFNVTLTRARSKFIMFVSDAILQHLPADADVARDAAHLQLFAENYCTTIDEEIELPYFDGGRLMTMRCRLRGKQDAP
jgi:superfamily I DNA and/or RNA helicase